MLKWNGKTATRETFVKVGYKNEVVSQGSTMPNIFKLGQSPSLSQLVSNFISIFLYLGKDTLSLRNIAILFASEPSQVKHITRRLYLVANIVEKAGIIQRGAMSTHYQLLLPVKEMIGEIFEKLSESNPFPAWSTESSLSRFDQPYLDDLFARRYVLFQGIANGYDRV